MHTKSSHLVLILYKNVKCVKHQNRVMLLFWNPVPGFFFVPHLFIDHLPIIRYIYMLHVSADCSAAVSAGSNPRLPSQGSKGRSSSAILRMKEMAPSHSHENWWQRRSREAANIIIITDYWYNIIIAVSGTGCEGSSGACLLACVMSL